MMGIIKRSSSLHPLSCHDYHQMLVFHGSPLQNNPSLKTYSENLAKESLLNLKTRLGQLFSSLLINVSRDSPLTLHFLYTSLHDSVSSWVVCVTHSLEISLTAGSSKDYSLTWFRSSLGQLFPSPFMYFHWLTLRDSIVSSSCSLNCQSKSEIEDSVCMLPSLILLMIICTLVFLNQEVGVVLFYSCLLLRLLFLFDPSKAVRNLSWGSGTECLEEWKCLLNMFT